MPFCHGNCHCASIILLLFQLTLKISVHRPEQNIWVVHRIRPAAGAHCLDFPFASIASMPPKNSTEQLRKSYTRNTLTHVACVFVLDYFISIYTLYGMLL